jgi:hypothetical protein
MTSPRVFCTTIAAFWLGAGCAADPDAPEATGSRQDEVLAENSLTNNALISNALISNALISNALISNALISNNLQAALLAGQGLASDPAALQVLQYMYSCAMPAGHGAMVAHLDAAEAGDRLVVDAITYLADGCLDPATGELKTFEGASDPDWLGKLCADWPGLEMPPGTTTKEEQAAEGAVVLAKGTVTNGEEAPAGETANTWETRTYTSATSTGSASLTLHPAVWQLVDDGRAVVVPVELRGALGVASSWATGECDLACQERVSACMLARVNAWGTPVALSVRTSDVVDQGQLTSYELQTYTVEEGAFFGNLFAAEPALYSCTGTGWDEGYFSADFRRACAHSDWQAAEGADCGAIINTGPCQEVCESTGLAYINCGDGNGYKTGFVMTVFLSMDYPGVTDPNMEDCEAAGTCPSEEPVQ